MLAASYVANPDCSFLASTSSATGTSLNKKNYDDDSKGSSMSNDANSSNDATMSEQGSTIAAVANYKRLQTQNIYCMD